MVDIPVQSANLSDDGLWRAIAQNTNAMSALVHQQLELNAAVTGSDIIRRTRQMQSNGETIDKLQRNYCEYTAELRRRHSLG
jgi:hypothetical protein